MNEPDPGRTLLVPIDYHGVSPATLDMLVRIAGQLNLRLIALLLESPRLQRVAELPFTTEILLGSGVERRLEWDYLIRRHSRLAEDTRRRLRELASQARVELSFESDRGDRWHASLARGGGLDIALVPRGRWDRGPGAGPHPRPAIPRLGVVLAGDEFDAKLAATALALEATGLIGSIYILSGRQPDPDLLAPLFAGPARCHLQVRSGLDPQGLSILIRRSPYDLLLVPRRSLEGIPPDALDAALDEAAGLVLAVS